jgi:hypothetical protein
MCTLKNVKSETGSSKKKWTSPVLKKIEIRSSTLPGTDGAIVGDAGAS